MSRIVKRSGGTDFAPALELGLKIMQNTPDVDNVFILVSDGAGKYPK